MKMIEYFGYKIAEKPNDKSDRAAYRFTKKECVIYDKSYMHFVMIKGSSVDMIKEFLEDIFLSEI